MSDEEIKRYLSGIGRKGGEAGTGESKLRGGKDYYRRISRLGVKARKAQQAKGVKTKTRKAKQNEP